MNIIYSFNKKGFEAACWEKEIVASSSDGYTFIPFNHERYLDPTLYDDSVKLDILYQTRNPRLIEMYADFEACIRNNKADAVIVTNCPPYHPDFLKKIPVYKALYSTDDPGATYKRTIPYLHAYDHVFYCAPSYSQDMNLGEKMRYCGMVNADWLPLSVFDFEYDITQTSDSILSKDRDIDIIYVGGFWRQKIDILIKVRKAFGKRFSQYGFFKIKHNLYLNIRYGYGGWVTPLSFEERVQLYQRAKIGINIHWNEYGLGNQRLYHLPANGVMQICDCPSYLNKVFEIGEEVVGYNNVDDLIDKINYYLKHEDKREQIALKGYQRTMNEYRFRSVTRKAGRLIKDGMKKIS